MHLHPETIKQLADYNIHEIEAQAKRQHLIKQTRVGQKRSRIFLRFWEPIVLMLTGRDVSRQKPSIGSYVPKKLTTQETRSLL